MKGYSAYVISDNKPKISLAFEKPVYHHITHQYPDTKAPPPKSKAIVYLILTDPKRQVQVGVVTLGSGVKNRPDNGFYHVTLSLGKTAKARESNDVIRDFFAGENTDIKSKRAFIELEIAPKFIEFAKRK